MRRFFSKYRGKVTANQDPLHLGRIQISVPSVFGEGRQSWAMPCTPYAGKDIGWFTVPPVDANVWVEFEGGDPDYPIWSGCFWGAGELPQVAKVEEPVKVQVFKTDGITITLSNLGDNKGLTVEVDKPVVEKPLKMIFNANGIELNNNNQTTAKFMAETIELKNGESSTVTIATDSIQLKESAIEIKLTNSSIELNSTPATIKLTTSSGIEINNTPSTVKISLSGIELSSVPASIKVEPAGIELSNPIANIKLSPIGVNVNNGALEVT
jgi:Type VI secretion system/phage-baseplate injector OB domain